MNRFRPASATPGDAGALLVLGLLALLGFRNTYAGWSYLIVGGAALVTGIAVTWLLRAMRQPVLVVAAAILVVFIVEGELLVLPGSSPISPATLHTLAVSAVLGWKQLLTTLPPVDAHDPLLVVPYLLGLLGGSIGCLLADVDPNRRRPVAVRAVTVAAAPVAVPVAMVILVIALGTHEAGAAVLDGIVVAAAALCWIALRRQRVRPLAADGAGRSTRVGAAAGLLAAGTLAAFVLTPVLAGHAAVDRVVLRDTVVPPFEINDYPSPLVGFRKYTADAKALYDQQLFTVSGLRSGDTVRIASLDDYDGSVWGATSSSPDGSFQRVGTAFGTRTADTVSVHVTIAAAYAAVPDLNAWLPVAGTVSAVDFDGARSSALAGSFRFNTGGSDGIVPGRLRAGDSYTIETVLATPTLPDNTQPFGVPALTENAQSVLSSHIPTWTGAASGLNAQLTAVAAYLQQNGFYSDGGPNEIQYLPGHGLGRLTAFVNGTQLVGDDEQYAAVFALVANDLGIPARVVFGATPEAGGVVRGQDIHAWVEVHVAGGAWVPIPQTAFMPAASKHPKPEPPKQTSPGNGAVVPPPNVANHPTSTTDNGSDEAVRPPNPPAGPSIWARIWAIAAPILTWAGPPLLVIALVIGGLLGWKSRRRRRRRTGGTPANRYAAGWQELVDLARDTGMEISGGLTRQQQSATLNTAVPVAPILPRQRGRHAVGAPAGRYAPGRATHYGVTVPNGGAPGPVPDDVSETVSMTAHLATTLTMVEPEEMPPSVPTAARPFGAVATEVQALADAADLVIYGPGDPGDELAADYWARIDKVRHTLLHQHRFIRRSQIRLSTRSLRSIRRNK
jgi:hypothetical protein